MGLAPNRQNNYPSQTFQNMLYTKGVAKNQLFSLFLAQEGIQSKAWFGGYSTDHVRESLASTVPAEELKTMTDQQVVSEIKWANLSSFFYWSTNLKQVTVNGTNIPLSAANVIYSSVVREI
jgi:hypothetical protein